MKASAKYVSISISEHDLIWSERYTLRVRSLEAIRNLTVSCSSMQAAWNV